MKKTIICNIPMKSVKTNVFLSKDLSLPVSKSDYVYPINSFLSQTISEGDEVRAILLVKKDKKGIYKDNIGKFELEMNSICGGKKIPLEYKIIETEFNQEKETHEQVMGRLVDEIEIGTHILADITFGPKDLPIEVFTALSFAERFLKCSIENIIYGQAEFGADGSILKTEIWDMIPLYYLNSLTNTIKCDDPEKARQMLKSLLTF